MNDMYEKVRKFMEIVLANADKSWVYWREIPPYRMGDEVLKKTDELIRCLTGGEGDLKRKCAELAFCAFILSEKGPEVQEKLEVLKISNAVETNIDPDKEAEKADKVKWEQKKKGIDISNKPWKG